MWITRLVFLITHQGIPVLPDRLPIAQDELVQAIEKWREIVAV
jgi:hypothetical protein